MRQPLQRYAAAFAATIALLAGASLAGAAPHLVRTLPNKATLIVRENRTRPVVSLQVWVRAGTRHETRPERGAASVLAQLAWEGSTNRSKAEFDESIQMVGGRYWSEAATGHILFEVDAPARDFDEVATLLADAIMHPKFEARAVEAAKAAARTTARNNLGHAALASANPLLAALHPGTPLGSPRTVPENEIGALTTPLVSRFHDAWFVGGNVMIIVVGDVDPDTAERVIAKAFAEIPNRKPPKERRVKERPLDGPKVVTAMNPPGAGEAAALTIGFRAPEWGSADALALDALVALIADYGDARLQRRLGEGPFLGASAQRSFESDGGSVSFSIVVRPEDLNEAESILFSEVARARYTPVDSEEFRRTIDAILARDLLAQADFAGVGRVSAIAAMQGTVGGDEVYAERIRALRPEDLVAVARKYLDTKEAVVVAMAPKNVVDSLDLYQGLESRVLESLTLAGAPYQGSGPHATVSDDKERRRRVDMPLASVPQEARDAGRGFVDRSVLDGGIRLLSSEDHGPALASIAVYLEGSVRYETEEINGISRLLRETLLTASDPKAGGRAYRFSLPEMGRLEPYQDHDMWGFTFTVPAHRWKDALERLGTMFSHPELDTVTVDATRLLALDEQSRWLSNDAARRRHLIFETKYKVSGYRLPLLGSRRSLATMPIEAVQKFYETFVVKPNMVVAVFGDIDAAEVAPAVTEAFRDVRDGPFAPGAVVKEGPFEGFREEWELGEGPMCTVSLAFNGPPANGPDVPILYIINSLYANPRGWLRTFVREKSLAVGETRSEIFHAADETTIIATLSVDGPLQEEHAAKMLFGQFRSTAGIKLVGLYAHDYEHARKHAVSTYLMGLASSARRAFHHARAEMHKLPVSSVVAFPARLLAISPDEIQQTAFRYFQFPDSGKRPYAVCETRPGGW